MVEQGEQLNPISEKPESLVFPHAETAVIKFKKFYPDAVQNQAALRDLLYGFFKDELTNSGMYKTENGEATFPYTSFNVTGAAKKLLGQNLKTPESSTPLNTKKHFIFGSFVHSNTGQFTFVEYAIHEYLKALPSVLKDLTDGKDPANVEIYTLGSPTSKFATVNESYTQRAQSEPYQTLGESYSEFIAKQLPQTPEERTKTNIVLQGYSMGSSLAAATAEHLLDGGLITQDAQERAKGKVYTQVLMDLPAAVHKKWTGVRKAAHTKLGFGFDGLTAIARREARTAIFAEAGFIENVGHALAHTGYTINMSNEQKQRKKVITGALIEHIQEGESYATDKVSANLRRGITDTTTATPISIIKGLAGRFRSDRRQDKPITKDLVSDDNNQREFLILTNHALPFYNRNELKRWKNATDVYLRVKARNTQIADSSKS